LRPQLARALTFAARRLAYGKTPLHKYMVNRLRFWAGACEGSCTARGVRSVRQPFPPQLRAPFLQHRNLTIRWNMNVALWGVAVLMVVAGAL